MAASALRWVATLNMGHRDQIVLRALASFADAKTLMAWPSLTTLETMTCYDRRTIQRAFQSLQKAGLIRDAREPGPRRYKQQMKWQLLMPAIFELTPEDMQVIRRNMARREFERALSPALPTTRDTEPELPGEIAHNVINRKAPTYPH